MRQPERPHLIHGTLLDQQKVLHEIVIVLVTKHKSGQRRMKGEAISKISFARQSPVPDGGPYILQYAFNGKQHKDRVFIKSGKLAAAQAS